jgi:hypothetical protein
MCAGVHKYGRSYDSSRECTGAKKYIEQCPYRYNQVLQLDTKLHLCIKIFCHLQCVPGLVIAQFLAMAMRGTTTTPARQMIISISDPIWKPRVVWERTWQLGCH